MSQITRHRLLSLLLATALVATLAALNAASDRAEAVDGPVDLVYVATGRNFPDALAGGTLAAAVNAPLLTVETDLPLPAATVTALEALDPDQIVVFGGEVAVSAEVVGALTTYARSGEVTRIAGEDRHDTAARIADALPAPAPIDADTLEGIDSSGFLGVDGTARDSAALEGRTASELRALTASDWQVQDAAFADPGFGYALPDGAPSGVRATVVLPGSRHPTDPIHVDVALTNDGDTFCDYALTVSGRAVVPGEVGLTPVAFSDTDGNGPDMVVPNRDSANPALTLVVDDADVLTGGTALQVLVERRGDAGVEDTCNDTLYVIGQTVRW